MNGVNQQWRLPLITENLLVQPLKDICGAVTSLLRKSQMRTYAFFSSLMGEGDTFFPKVSSLSFTRRIDIWLDIFRWGLLSYCSDAIFLNEDGLEGNFYMSTVERFQDSSHSDNLGAARCAHTEQPGSTSSLRPRTSSLSWLLITFSFSCTLFGVF